MRKEDKKKNMINVNKSFQERINNENDPINVTEVETYIHTKDIYPELSKILK